MLLRHGSLCEPVVVKRIIFHIRFTGYSVMYDYLVQMFHLAKEGETQGVFFWFSAYTFVILLFSLIKQINASSWPGVRGEMLDERIREFGFAFAPSDKDYRVKVEYRYSVDGQEYTGKRLSPWVFVTNNNAAFILHKQMEGIEKLEGASVKVFYNPRNPAKSFLILPGRTGMIITALLSVTLPFFYWLKYYG